MEAIKAFTWHDYSLWQQQKQKSAQKTKLTNNETKNQKNILIKTRLVGQHWWKTFTNTEEKLVYGSSWQVLYSYFVVLLCAILPLPFIKKVWKN